MNGKGEETQPGTLANAASARSKLVSGVVWNLGALAFLALAGIALNLVIGRYYGPETLGAFNIAFAIYIALSQIAVFGLQFAALQAVSVADREDAGALSQVVYGGLALCLSIALAVTLLALAATPVIASLFPRVPDLETAWLMAAPGLLFFAANKYLLGVVNGLQHMRAYAVFQVVRFVGILVGLGLMIAAGAAGKHLTLILTIAEVLLSVVLVAYVLRAAPPVLLGGLAPTVGRHFRFGLRILPAGLVAELNTRVDVLMLGALLNDRAAGIYTVAALVYEAALQAVVVIRNNISPQLARDIKAGAGAHILSFSRKLGALVTMMAMVGAALALALFPLFLDIAFPGKDFSEAAAPLTWLMAALCLAAAPLCYSLVFSQADRPVWQSIMMLIMLLANIALNALLIPAYGIAGAGMAMGLSAVIGGVAVIGLSRAVLGVRLFV